jgi:hypothetical protein
MGRNPFADNPTRRHVKQLQGTHTMKIIAAGTLTEGFQYHGPFYENDERDLVSYADHFCDYTSTSVHTLIEPDGEEFLAPQAATIERLRKALADIHACVIGSEADLAARVSYTETRAHKALETRDGAGVDIAIVGNPVDGFKYYGPFASEQLAMTWADRVHGDDTWWVAALVRQED